MSPVRVTPNSVALRVVSVCILGVAGNWIATATQEAWLPYLVASLLVVLIILTIPGGMLSPAKYSASNGA